MKTLKIISIVFRWILAILILIFSIATFMGKSYLQTSVLVLLSLSLIWWPSFLTVKWNKKVSLSGRILFILILAGLNFVAFRPEPKTSIYTSEENRKELMDIYGRMMNDWPDDTEEIYLDTRYGKVHLLACGDEEDPPLVMIHAASMGAHSWAENLGPLTGNYRIYSFDNIGEGNKSQLNDALRFPDSGEEIADFYAGMFDQLGIACAPVFGASNGGYIAQVLAYYHPEKVESLALFGPMGLTQLTGTSIFMLSVASMYPFQFVRDFVTRWAISDDEYVIGKYGDWFNCMMKATIPSVSQPVPMTTEQKKAMDLPVLLFLGTNDGIVGDAEFAAQTASEYPDIRIITLESGHLIAVEHAETVNQSICNFLAGQYPE